MYVSYLFLVFLRCPGPRKYTILPVLGHWQSPLLHVQWRHVLLKPDMALWLYLFTWLSIDFLSFTDLYHSPYVVEIVARSYNCSPRSHFYPSNNNSSWYFLALLLCSNPRGFSHCSGDSHFQKRMLTQTFNSQVKVLAVLYDVRLPMKTGIRYIGLIWLIGRRARS